MCYYSKLQLRAHCKSFLFVVAHSCLFYFQNESVSVQFSPPIAINKRRIMQVYMDLFKITEFYWKLFLSKRRERQPFRNVVFFLRICRKCRFTIVLLFYSRKNRKRWSSRKDMQIGWRYFILHSHSPRIFCLLGRNSRFWWHKCICRKSVWNLT